MTPRALPVLLLFLLLLLAGALTGCLSGEEIEADERRDVATLELPPGEGLEWKVQATAGEVVAFSWNATGPLAFDLHGETLDGGQEESYRFGQAARDEGTFEVRFDGLHGWYWENRGDAVVTVEVLINGTYAFVGQV